LYRTESSLVSYAFLNLSARWHSWLRHCATSRKIAGLIPDGVTGILHWLNPSGSTKSLGSTQPLTQMGTRNMRNAPFWLLTQRVEVILYRILGFFYVHGSVYRISIHPTRCNCILAFISRNSTCFGRSSCPSSGATLLHRQPLV
jgi:hypothetical protein